jgi:hypothetical protein
MVNKMAIFHDIDYESEEWFRSEFVENHKVPKHYRVMASKLLAFYLAYHFPEHIITLVDKGNKRK